MAKAEVERLRERLRAQAQTITALQDDLAALRTDWRRERRERARLEVLVALLMRLREMERDLERELRQRQ